MIKQKPISLKIDRELLDQLDQEVELGWDKRNAVINKAIAFYLEYKDAYRHEKYANSVGENACQESLAFIKKYLVHNVQFFLDKIDHH